MHIGAFDSSTHVIDHREHRLPDDVAPLVLQEQCHVQGYLETQVSGVSEIPRVVDQFRSRQNWYRLALGTLKKFTQHLPVTRVVTYWKHACTKKQ